jgi:hypothetical protein
VTPKEEEAVEAACELLRRWLPKAPDGATYSRELRRLEMLSLDRLSDLFDPAKHEEFASLIEDARSGKDPDADAILCEWGALAVSCAVNIPLPLREYLASILFERAETGRRRGGPHPDTHLPRNFVITYAVARVSERGFSPTRNRARGAQESACSIVTKALKRTGRHMGEDTIEKIWEKRSQFSGVLREYIQGRLP